MRTFRIVISPSAEIDLDALFRHVLTTSGVARAEDVVADLLSACRQLRHFPLRGVRRDDLRPGVRVIGHRRRASIAFVVEPDEVVILHIAWRGRDLPTSFGRRV